MEIRTCKVCNLTSDITKFVIKENKIYGRRCKKCNSIANNQRLKEKKYYSNYYILNKETFTQRDKARYAKLKLLKNEVLFKFERCNNVSPPTDNIIIDDEKGINHVTEKIKHLEI